MEPYKVIPSANARLLLDCMRALYAQEPYARVLVLDNGIDWDSAPAFGAFVNYAEPAGMRSGVLDYQPTPLKWRSPGSTGWYFHAVPADKPFTLDSVIAQCHRLLAGDDVLILMHDGSPMTCRFVA